MPMIVGTDLEDPRSRPALSPARRRLAAKHRPLALWLAAPFGRSQPWLAADFRGVAGLALSEATAVYRKGLGASYRTFACDRIVGALKNHRRDSFPRGYRLARLRASRPAIGPLGDRPVIAPPAPPALDARDEAEALIRRLPGPHAAVMDRIYLRGETQSDAARALGRSPTRVSAAHREALAALGVRVAPGRHAAPQLRASTHARPDRNRTAPKGS